MTAETIADNFLTFFWFVRAGVEGGALQFEGRCNESAN